MDKHTKDFILISAAGQGNIAAVRQALADGANIHANEDEALRIAAHNRYYPTVALLLENGADIHAKNDDALRLATESGDSVTAALLKDWADKHPVLSQEGDSKSILQNAFAIADRYSSSSVPAQQTKKDETSPSAEDAAAEGRTTNMEKQLEELKAAKARAKALGFNRPADLGRTPGGRE